ncbi:MAG: Cu+-exporting ATPase [Rhodothermales bacterium]|jgi:Cu+-exporting ATPase
MTESLTEPIELEGACIHCGTACSSSFCCTGCEYAYDLLQGSGLGRFYALASDAGVRPEESDFAALDDDALVARLARFCDDRNVRISLRVPAIHCVACVWLLENLHRLDPGVLASEVDLGLGQVTLTYERRRTSLRKLAELLTVIGYEPAFSLDDTRAADSAPDREALRRIALAGFCFANSMLMSIPSYLGMAAADHPVLHGTISILCLALATVALLGPGREFWRAGKLLWHRVLSIDLPLLLGMLALYGQTLWDVSSGAGHGYGDSLTGLIFFLLLGRMFQRKTHEGVRFDQDLAAYFPLRADGIQAGDEIDVRHGEIVPADGEIIGGEGLLDYSFVTGESAPVPATEGGVFAGARQLGGALRIKVTEPVDSAYLVRLWSSRQSQSAEPANQRWVGAFLLVVAIFACGSGLYWWSESPAMALRVFTAVLIVACPCGLALARPLTGGFLLRALARRGVLLRDANVLQRLGRIATLVFDKTGTLTTPDSGAMRFQGEFSPLIAAAAAQSGHPLCRMINREFPANSALSVSEFCETPGMGIEACVEGKRVRIGKSENGLPQIACEIDGKPVGYFAVETALRSGIGELLTGLARRLRLVLVSGDSEHERQRFAPLFGQAPLFFGQSPDDKAKRICELRKSGPVLMIGDGLNDALALREADVGLAVSDDQSAFFPACGGLLLPRGLASLNQVMGLCRRSRLVIGASLCVSLLYNIFGLYFAATGLLNPLLAAVLMPLSSLSVLAVTSAGCKALEVTA